jgi:hypothetical protein
VIKEKTSGVNEKLTKREREGAADDEMKARVKLMKMSHVTYLFSQCACIHT